MHLSYLNERAHAVLLDLASCEDSFHIGLGDKLFYKWFRNELGWICEDDTTACAWERERMQPFVGSESFLAEMLPFLGVNRPLSIHREEERCGSWNPLLLRFSDDDDEPDDDDATESNGMGSGVAERRSASGQQWRIRRLQELVPQVLYDERMFDIRPPMPGTNPTRRYRREIEQLVEELIPRTALGPAPRIDPFSESTALGLLPCFEAIIQPCINLALPAGYKPCRPLLFSAICEAFRNGDSLNAWYALELWARLNPAPVEYLDEILQEIDVGAWFQKLNDVQLVRVGLLLTDVILNIPTNDGADFYRHQASRWLVGWSEGKDRRKQLLARVVLTETCDFNFFGWCFGSSERISPGLKGLRTTDNRQTQLDALLGPSRVLELDPWRSIALSFDGICPTPDRHWNARFQSSLFKTVVAHSQNNLARTVALWNLSWFGLLDSGFRETCHNAYHLARDLNGRSQELIRKFVRDRNGGFLQDFGPVAAIDGRVFEQAALRISQIFDDDRLLTYLVQFISRWTNLGPSQSFELLEEFLQSQMLTEAKAKALAGFNREHKGSLKYMRQGLWWWLQRRNGKGTERLEAEMDALIYRRDRERDIAMRLIYRALPFIDSADAEAVQYLFSRP